jgi:hypothetical protein
MIHRRTTLALTIGGFLAGVLLGILTSMSLAQRSSGYWRYDGGLDARNALEAEAVRKYRNGDYDEASGLMEAATELRSRAAEKNAYEEWSFWLPASQIYFAILGTRATPPPSKNGLIVSRCAVLAFYNKAGNSKAATRALVSAQSLSASMGAERCNSLGLSILEAYP